MSKIKSKSAKNDLLDKKVITKIDKIRDYIEKTPANELEGNENKKSTQIIDLINSLRYDLGNNKKTVELFDNLIDLSKKRITEIYGDKINKEIVLLNNGFVIMNNNIRKAHERYFNGECVVKPEKNRQNLPIIYSLIPISLLLHIKAFCCNELKKYDDAITSLFEELIYDPLNYTAADELLYSYEKKKLNLVKNDKLIEIYNLLYVSACNSDELIDSYCKMGQYCCNIKEYRKALACFTIVYRMINIKPHKKEEIVLIDKYGKNWIEKLDSNIYEIARDELSRDLYNFLNKDKVEEEIDINDILDSPVSKLLNSTNM